MMTTNETVDPRAIGIQAAAESEGYVIVTDPTLEEWPAPEAVPFLNTNIRWAYPDDLPYSYIEYPADIDLEWAAQRYIDTVLTYRGAREAVALQLPVMDPQLPVQQPPYSPPATSMPGNAPAGPPAQQRPAAPAQGQQGGPQLFCGEHRVAVQLSKAEYQRYDTLEDGSQVLSRYFHSLDQPYIDAQTNKTVSSHSLWRRELVHADGSPVEQSRQGA